jgi:hypothetical protein
MQADDYRQLIAAIRTIDEVMQEQIEPIILANEKEVKTWAEGKSDNDALGDPSGVLGHVWLAAFAVIERYGEVEEAGEPNHDATDELIALRRLLAVNKQLQACLYQIAFLLRRTPIDDPNAETMEALTNELGEALENMPLPI